MANDKKDAYYFKHDTNARNDIYISAARSEVCEMSKKMEKEDVHKLINLSIYGFYFIIIEILREQSDFKIKDNSVVRKFISKESEIPLPVSNQMLDLLISEDYGLIKKEDGHLFSKRLISDMVEMNEVRGKFSKAGKASAEARKSANVQTNSNSEKTPHSAPKAPKPMIFAARFYSLWNDYCNTLGGNSEERKTELKYLESNFKENEMMLINKLYASIVQEKTKAFFKDFTAKK